MTYRKMNYVFVLVALLWGMVNSNALMGQVNWNHTWWSPYPTQNSDPDLVDVTWESAHIPSQPVTDFEQINTYAIMLSLPNEPPNHALIDAEQIFQDGRKTQYTGIVDKAVYLPHAMKDGNGVTLYRYVDMYRKAEFANEESPTWRIKKYPNGTVTAVEL